MKNIDIAKSALHDLYGLLPHDQRKYADDYVRVLEQALYGYSQALDFQTAVSAKLYWAETEQKRVETNMLEIEG